MQARKIPSPSELLSLKKMRVSSVSGVASVIYHAGPPSAGILIMNQLTSVLNCYQGVLLQLRTVTTSHFLVVMARCFGASAALLVFWQLVAGTLSLGMAEFNYLSDYLYPPAECE